MDIYIILLQLDVKLFFHTFTIEHWGYYNLYLNIIQLMY